VNIAELALPSILTYIARQETKRQDKKIINKDKDKIRQVYKKGREEETKLEAIKR
jgi:hypothetical protein